MNSEEEQDFLDSTEFIVTQYRGDILLNSRTSFALYMRARDQFEEQHYDTLHFMYDKMNTIVQYINPQFISFTFDDFLDFCLLVSTVTVTS